MTDVSRRTALGLFGAVASFDPLPGPAGDNSSYRLAIRGMYRRLPPIR
ncbi:MAG: hypothetical protein IRZ05_17810, partial [Micromonosporaceae bacterium]|nr:hypothetical protein [Micromonosporaceae bacterium]